MKKRKTLKQLKYYYRHYLDTFPQVKRRGQPTVRRHIGKLQAQICEREAKKIASEST